MVRSIMEYVMKIKKKINLFYDIDFVNVNQTAEIRTPVYTFRRYENRLEGNK